MERKIIENLITTIEKELKNSTSTQYICENGSIIDTDVGYVEEWFDKYKNMLREKFCQ